MFYDRLVDDADREWLFKFVRDTCAAQLSVEFDKLFERLDFNGDGKVEEDDLRSLIYCDFADPKVRSAAAVVSTCAHTQCPPQWTTLHLHLLRPFSLFPSHIVLVLVSPFSLRLPVRPSIRPLVFARLSMPVRFFSVCLPVRPSACLSVRPLDHARPSMPVRFPSLCLPVRPPVCLFVRPSACLCPSICVSPFSVRLPVLPSACLCPSISASPFSLCLSSRPPVCLPVRPSACLCPSIYASPFPLLMSTRPSARLPVRPSVRLSVPVYLCQSVFRLSTRPSVRLSLPVYLCQSVFPLSVFLSARPFVHACQSACPSACLPGLQSVTYLDSLSDRSGPVGGPQAVRRGEGRGQASRGGGDLPGRVQQHEQEAHEPRALPLRHRARVAHLARHQTATWPLLIGRRGRQRPAEPHAIGCAHGRLRPVPGTRRQGSMLGPGRGA